MYSLRPGEIGEEKCTLCPLGRSLVKENVVSVPMGDWRRKCTLCTLGRLAKKMYSLHPGEIGEENVLSSGEIGEENVLCPLSTRTQYSSCIMQMFVWPDSNHGNDSFPKAN